MLTRTLTGIVFLLVVISAIVFHPLTFAALFLLIITLGLHEFYTLIEKSGYQPQKWMGGALGASIFLGFYMLSRHVETGLHIYTAYPLFFLFGFALFPLFFLVFFIELYRKKDQPFANIGFTFLGLIYVAIPLSLWCFISNTIGCAYNFHYLLGFFIIMWTADTGAYLFGKFMGKTKLFERISPKKTWEGLIGGILLSLLAAWIISLYYKELYLSQWIIVALMTSILGTFGDLTESMFKRSLDIKDSGTILPGHGGILDRFDGVFISSPFVITYMLFIPHHF
jgi:phosphatidate cytidylyltransferase